MIYDIVIKNGTIVEPRSEQQTRGNIGIKDGIISKISREEMEGKEIIDATGSIVCPGFIDIHSHLNSDLYSVWLSVSQGITTCLSGNCGMSPFIPLGEFLDSLETSGYPINFATLVGHSWTLRDMVGIQDPNATATSEQTLQMVAIAEQALEDGAFGVSLGLEYAPGATAEEYMPLVELAAKYDKLVPIHIRTDALDFAVGIREAIAMSEKTGARVQISHLAYQLGVHPEVTQMALVMIENAIQKGLPIMCDSGIYESFATYVNSAVFADGWNQRYACEISDLMISTGKYAGQRATPEILAYIRANEEDAVGTAFVGVIPDLARAIIPPYVMMSTDAGLSDKPGNGHPQDVGTFPRFFQKLVREQGVLSMMEAVKKSSYLPAIQMGISQTKGWLGSGADADIVIFNPKTIRDNADYIGIGQPDARPTGINYVIVNGVIVVAEETMYQNRLPGKILRQPNKLWSL